MFLRLFQRLLPSGEAFRIVVDKLLRRFFVALEPTFELAKTDADLGYLDLLPGDTRRLREWEDHFGIPRSGDETEAQRRLALAGEWAATGGQSPGYIQGVLRAAGFSDLYVHEWWERDTGDTRDPHDYTEDPLAGSCQCGEDFAECGDPDAQCDEFLVNEPGYFVNLNLSPVAPPPIPSDPDYYPFFLYIGGEDLDGDPPQIDFSRRTELQRLLQKLKPSQQWIVLRVDFTGDLLTEDGETLLTEDDFILSV